MSSTGRRAPCHQGLRHKSDGSEVTERENHGGKDEGVTGAAVNHPEMDGKQSASHRGRERFRRLTWTAASSVLLRSITFSASFIQIPLTVRYLGPERYGY